MTRRAAAQLAFGATLCATASVDAQSRAASAPSAPSAPKTWINPLDLDYKYNFEQLNLGISYRSGADPVIVRYRDEYYAFVTIANGYWRSRDLARWTHVKPNIWPFEEIVAPAALVVRDTVYLMQSMTEPRPILITTRPETGQLEFYNRLLPHLPNVQGPNTPAPGPPGSVPPGPWDPAIFHDPDTERWFMYWDSSNFYPLYGIELDKSKRLTYVGTPRPVIALDPAKHGWERFGQDHGDTITPFIEGAWMTKHRGRYYLQYGAPGTEYNVYANGTYVGDDPLGPFTYAPYNPVAYKPGGFMVGTGHGNTFEDRFGNYWNTGTAWVAVNWNFERRVVMHPTGFDADGDMYADTRFGDFPHLVPTKKWQRSDELFAGWMLLSYRKQATASSAMDSFPAPNVTDENPRTFWVAGVPSSKARGQTLTVDLGQAYDVKAVQVNYTDYKSGLYGSDSTVYTQFRIHTSLDGKAWTVAVDLSRNRTDRPNAYLELPRTVRARYVRYEHGYVASRHLAISDLRVFGNGAGPTPSTPAGLSVTRASDPRDATVRWSAVPGAVGYNIRWGIGREKLRQTYQIWADRPTTQLIRALTVGQEYWFAIESFDENGVSTLSEPIHVP